MEELYVVVVKVRAIVLRKIQQLLSNITVVEGNNASSRSTCCRHGWNRYQQYLQWSSSIR